MSVNLTRRDLKTVVRVSRVRHHRFAFIHHEANQVRNGTKWLQSDALVDVFHP